MSTITVLLPDNTPYPIEVPTGSAAYWGWQVLYRAGLVVVTPAEPSHLPYLGQVACPDDKEAWAQIALDHRETL